RQTRHGKRDLITGGVQRALVDRLVRLVRPAPDMERQRAVLDLAVVELVVDRRGAATAASTASAEFSGDCGANLADRQRTHRPSTSAAAAGHLNSPLAGKIRRGLHRRRKGPDQHTQDRLHAASYLVAVVTVTITRA